MSEDTRIADMREALTEARQQIAAFKETVHSLQDRVHTLELSLWGVDRENGLRGDLRKLVKQNEHMQQSLEWLKRGYWLAAGAGPAAAGMIWLLKSFNVF